MAHWQRRRRRRRGKGKRRRRRPKGKGKVKVQEVVAATAVQGQGEEDSFDSLAALTPQLHRRVDTDVAPSPSVLPLTRLLFSLHFPSVLPRPPPGSVVSVIADALLSSGLCFVAFSWWAVSVQAAVPPSRDSLLCGLPGFDCVLQLF